MPKKLSDLVGGWPTGLDVRDVVEDWRKNPVTESSVTPDPHEAVTARLPGDEREHPLGEQVSNPMPEIGGPLSLSRALRAGHIPFDKEKAVRRYIDQYQKMTGEVLYDPRNH